MKSLFLVLSAPFLLLGSSCFAEELDLGVYTAVVKVLVDPTCPAGAVRLISLDGYAINRVLVRSSDKEKTKDVRRATSSEEISVCAVVDDSVAVSTVGLAELHYGGMCNTQNLGIDDACMIGFEAATSAHPIER